MKLYRVFFLKYLNKKYKYQIIKNKHKKIDEYL